MKKIRVFYKKYGRMVFVSHLDMNRYFIRLLRLSKLPIWYTEGFNPHPYLTFALPLPLGYESNYEIVDFRVQDDNLSYEYIKSKLQEAAVDGIEIIKATEPVNKPSVIKSAEYIINFAEKIDENKLFDFLKHEEIIITKLTKKKKEKQVNITEMIFGFEFLNLSDGSTALKLALAAGATENLNPSTVLQTYEEQNKLKLPFYKIIRNMLFDENGEEFI